MSVESARGPAPWLQLLLRPKCGMKFKAAIKFGKDNFKCMAQPNGLMTAWLAAGQDMPGNSS